MESIGNQHFHEISFINFIVKSLKKLFEYHANQYVLLETHEDFKRMITILFKAKLYRV